MQPNSLRIIGGIWRGRRLRFPNAPALRPTPDRVRETLFNWLGQNLHGLRCLDLFAGSGALGLEALSRHALHVSFVDRSRAVCRALEQSTRSLGAVACELHCADALEFLRHQGRVRKAPDAADPFDLVFLDPPYREQLIETVMPLLEPVVSPSARIYLEAEYPITALPGWTILKAAKAGMVYYGLAKRGSQ